ncbi:sigma-70 family RNA polymerase sigma factor [Candidimonas sp. SYP-B2681]|uniref:sigma-70 family RNA polymerase sigma factor n=1 Tax=Candidimonas sp. SYP-B2681 TaxID=2497686 RepID=UPI000F868A85|nr:sigma-70 family RNA polymerase sigma factor [Candidimonas sp. SYP-B2681]RTZ39320.1 sigma-70 family RNA polymerase sigma factor [Candidimonas sp. SYP-B2681]
MAVSPFDYEAALFACAHGDQIAFQDLYLHESPHMLALCLKMLTQRSTAEDLMRDTFVTIWKNASSYDPELGSARAWIYSIMRYRVLNHLRRSGCMQSSETQWSLDDTRGVDVAASSASGNRLVEIMSELDERQRRPILMAFYNGYTYEQIATRLHTPAVLIKAQVKAGLQQIQEHQEA